MTDALSKTKDIIIMTVSYLLVVDKSIRCHIIFWPLIQWLSCRGITNLSCYTSVIIRIHVLHICSPTHIWYYTPEVLHIGGQFRVTEMVRWSDTCHGRRRRVVVVVVAVPVIVAPPEVGQVVGCSSVIHWVIPEGRQGKQNNKLVFILKYVCL